MILLYFLDMGRKKSYVHIYTNTNIHMYSYIYTHNPLQSIYMSIWVNRIINEINIKEHPFMEASFTSPTQLLSLSLVLLHPAHSEWCWVPGHPQITSLWMMSSGVRRGLDPGRFAHRVPPASLCSGPLRKYRQWGVALFPSSFCRPRASLTAKGRRQRHLLVEQNLYSNHLAELALFSAEAGHIWVTDSSGSSPLLQRLHTDQLSCVSFLVIEGTQPTRLNGPHCADSSFQPFDAVL